MVFTYSRLLLFIFICSIYFSSITASSYPLEQSSPTNEPCDQSLLPIVMLHGFLASGDTYEKQALRFIANGWCPDRIFIFDWNTLGGSGNLERLDQFIMDVLDQSDADKVFLAGHSAGSGLCYEYLKDGSRASNVAAYVHLAGRSPDQPAGPDGDIPTLNIFSDGDLIVRGDSIEGAQNIHFSNHDHYQVATSVETFEAMYYFFTNKKPQTNQIIPSESTTVVINGKTITLGENSPVAGAKILIFEVDPTTGFRLRSEADLSLTADDGGYWGPFEAKVNQPYEFVLHSGDDARVIHYYRSGFSTDNNWVYLRSLPPLGSPAGLLLAGLPKDDEQSVVGVFISDQAVIHGRDELNCNGFNLATEAFATASGSNIAWFLYDANRNQQSDGTSIGNFSFIPFLAGVDLFFDTQTPQSITVTFNDKTIACRNWNSDTDGIIVIVFD